MSLAAQPTCYCAAAAGGMTTTRSSLTVPIASSALATTWEARARLGASVTFDSRSSAWARMMPSWLFRRWNKRRSSGVSFNVASRARLYRDASATSSLVTFLPHSVSRRTVRVMRITPQGVDEDTNRTACRSNVFDLTRREPIVDGASADADQFARFHDRDGLSFHRFSASSHRIGVTLAAL